MCQLGVGDTLQVGTFCWVEEFVAHTEINNILMDMDIKVSTHGYDQDGGYEGGEVDYEFEVVTDNGVVNSLTNEKAYRSEGTWYLDRWLPSTEVAKTNHDCVVDSRGCVAKLTGTNPTTLRIVGTQGWQQRYDGWPKIYGL